MEAAGSRFTAAEGGTRLAITAAEKNLLVTEYASFITTRLIYEEAYNIRGLLSGGRRRSIFVTRASRVKCTAYELSILTDLKVAEAVEYRDVADWPAEMEVKEVLVCTSQVFKQIIDDGVLLMTNVNVLVIDSCHLIFKDENLKYIMKQYKLCQEASRPRILALTYPIFAKTEAKTSNSDSDSKIDKIDDAKTSEENSESKIDKSLEKEALDTPLTESKDKQNVTLTEDVTEQNAVDKEISATSVNKEDLTDKVLSSNSTDTQPSLTPTKLKPDQQFGECENLDDFEMYEKLEWKIEELERELCCEMDLAEDIDGGKRLVSAVTKPNELIVEYDLKCSENSSLDDYKELERFMRDTIRDAEEFIYEHRYDPSEIYGDELYEEFKSIPDPGIEPKAAFTQFLYVLEQMGPYGADKAAFSLLTKIEKLKIKVPYERHFLLLCLCTTVFVKIRAYADCIFSNYNDWDKIKIFCTPKIHRFAEILEKFKPNDNKDRAKDIIDKGSDRKYQAHLDGNNLESQHNIVNVDNKTDLDNEQVKNNSDDLKENQNKIKKHSNRMLEAIEKCDFESLGNKLQDKANILEANLKEIDIDENIEPKKEEVKITECKMKVDDSKIEDGIEDGKNFNDKETGEVINVDNSGDATNNRVRENEDGTKVDSRTGDTMRMGFKRPGNRTRGRGRPRAAPRAAGPRETDSLCGIVFVSEPLVAKILFALIVDMSRWNSNLGYLCAQYCCADSAAPWGPEAKQREEVLKKFRMHDCNLLVATSALEEGIDLPRCNLALRWDPPQSYRSYSLSRGRARASRAAAILCAPRDVTDVTVKHLAVYSELDQIITRKCGCGIQDEPPQAEEDQADLFCPVIKSYTAFDDKPKTTCQNASKHVKVDVDTDKHEHKENNLFSKDVLDTPSKIVESKFDSDETKGVDSVSRSVKFKCQSGEVDVDSADKCESVVEGIASVDLNSAIALINRYCGKLPSDTFTRLAPYWKTEKILLQTRDGRNRDAFVCTLRLPLNAPVKYNIVGHPMPTRVLARRMVALQACRILHRSGELDDQLMPIGKENFVAPEEPACLDSCSLEAESDCDLDGGDARPGTTKRRQYYYKRTAAAFTNCEPAVDTCDCEIDPRHDHGGHPCIKGRPAGDGGKNLLYNIASTLWCVLPERYNTRGRRLHAPQHARQATALMTSDNTHSHLHHMQIPAFPVYTRSGEVRVSVEHVPDADVRLSPKRAKQIRRFMRFVFAEVLRVRRCGMKLDTRGMRHNNYYVVPTVKSIRADGSAAVDVDWPFLELIYQHTELKKRSQLERPILWHLDDEELEDMEKEYTNKSSQEAAPSTASNSSSDKQSETASNQDNTSDETSKSQDTANSPKLPETRDKKEKRLDNPLLKPGEVFVFDAEKYREAVVTPWYRNQDQPQFFLVAEICWQLRPDSAFSSAAHATFREYYRAKYGVTLTQRNQPLLDVDHTSARLNLLTPRYVNRKGVALPVSSERTRRAKRDRLDQKQILVPELCRVHPFAAPLWFATVALPCVLYRINALLIADEIRRAVAVDVALGVPRVNPRTCPGYTWPPLDFGWSLAEVLNAEEKNEKRKAEEENAKKEEEDEKKAFDDLSADLSPDAVVSEPAHKTINDILAEKEKAENQGFEIGTWSNEMASSIPAGDLDEEEMGPLPDNLTFCTSASGGTNWCEPVEKPKSQFAPSRRYSVADSDCSFMSSDFDTDSDLNSEASDDDTDTSGFCSKGSNAAMGVRIEYKTAHEAEAVEVERKKTKIAPAPDEADDEADRREFAEFIRSGDPPKHYVEKFRNAVAEHEKTIREKFLIKYDQPIVDILPEINKDADKINDLNTEHQVTVKNKNKIKTTDCDDENENIANMETIVDDAKNTDDKNTNVETNSDETVKTDAEIENLANDLSKIDFEMNENNRHLFEEIFPYKCDLLDFADNKVTIESIEKNKRLLLNEYKNSLSEDEVKKLHCFSMRDVDIDSPDYVNEKITNIGFDTKEEYIDKFSKWDTAREFNPYFMEGKDPSGEFDFDFQPDLNGHPGPSPSVILQALTMSNANDGINLERLETVGDSFLKFAITAHLYCARANTHEGKLSHLRSKQVSNLNLYRLGRARRLGARMTAMKFEPHDNWLPPCHSAPPALASELQDCKKDAPTDGAGCFIPYNLITQHSIPDKSIADCVEALIGAYLLWCGPRGALLLMSWLGIQVLPRHSLVLKHPPPMPKCKTSSSPGIEPDSLDEEAWAMLRPVGSLRPTRNEHGQWVMSIFGELKAPPSPLLRYVANPEGELERMLSGYDALETTLRYRFKDRSLLLQALTHASHHRNCLTDCYQRLEFLGDAILDYLITRHLYEDARRHSPGALTDLRSALVNNTIFATMAARHGFHKYFRHMSPGLNEVLTKYIKIQEENGHSISEEHYLIQEDEMEQAEDVEVPKALGDLFESVAGAIFLDSGMSLGAVWRSFGRLMVSELEAFSAAAPKSPVRDLLEAEPDTAKFGKPERLADGRRVRVCVEVFGRGTFRGVGRNYRIAKGTAARCALRHLRSGKYR